MRLLFGNSYLRNATPASLDPDRPQGVGVETEQTQTLQLQVPALMIVSRSKRPSGFKTTGTGVVMVHRGVIQSAIGSVRRRADLRTSVEEHWHKGQCCQENSSREPKGLEVCFLHDVPDSLEF
jgi:hypothetical protein